MADPRFSIITPTFNSGSKLLETYKSVAVQAVDFEYIIMDGASTDETKSIGEKLAAEDKRVRFFSEPDRNTYDAMNKAITKARGDFLYFLGAGDLLIAGSLGEIARHLPAELNTFVYGDCSLNGERYFGEFDKHLLGYQNICHQGIFYGKKVFEICGNYDIRFRAWADWDLNMRCFGNRGIRKIYVPVVVAVFELGGLSTPGDDLFRAQRMQLIRRHLGWITYLQIALRPAYNRLRATAGRILRPFRK